MEPTVEVVTSPVTLGEGPHWDSDEQALYFVSIFDCTINKYVPATGKHTKAKLDGKTTFIIPVEGRKHHFVVGLDRKVVEVQWSGEDDAATLLRTVAVVDEQCPNNRFNDAKADPKGRLFAGTMGHEYEPGKFDIKKGSLYRIDPEGGVHRLVSDVDISNGLCWDEGGRAFYYADSFEYAIRRYDYDVNTGNISNPGIMFKYSDHGLKGIVDGMSIDTDGNLWVANFDNHQVIKIDPKAGKILQTIKLPALQVTSLVWGGKGLDELFPSNEELKLKWLDILGKSNVSVGKRTALCSTHFEEHCFRYGLVNGTRILRDGSLPTLNLTTYYTKKKAKYSTNEIKPSESQEECCSHTKRPITDATSDSWPTLCLTTISVENKPIDTVIKTEPLESGMESNSQTKHPNTDATLDSWPTPCSTENKALDTIIKIEPTDSLMDSSSHAGQSVRDATSNSWPMLCVTTINKENKSIDSVVKIEPTTSELNREENLVNH
ncbi:unnamed protein product [Chilo suppressalis]|uniref:THAP-type domain-containing protein n=1 Tax=Chilo suppressalis TaxID=168631 RepID=A0ABN8AZQ4_CHISP|nr:unnamed protein product [Chilo suppressalis]